MKFREGTGIQRLYDELMELAYSSAPNTQLPRYQELCDTFGASRSSLREALDELERRHIIYRKPRQGIYVSPNLHNKVVRLSFCASLVEGGFSPFWGMLWGLLMREARLRAESKKHHYQFELVPSSAEAQTATCQDIVQEYREGLLHAALMIGIHSTTVHPSDNPDVPTIGYAGWGGWQIWHSSNVDAELAVGALADQGCRTIACWNPWSPWTRISSRDPKRYPPRILSRALMRKYHQKYFSDLIDEHGRVVDDISEANDLSNYQQGYLHALVAFSGPGRKPDGVLITDDLVTSGAMTAFDRLGIRVGVDINVVTLSNAGSTLLAGWEDVLTLIEYNPADICSAMFELLDVLLSGERPRERIVSVTPTLVPCGTRNRNDELLKLIP